MSNSSLVTYTKRNSHYNPRPNGESDINTLTIHMVQGQLSVEELGRVFLNKEASSNYGIGTDGRIALYVDEKNRSWCSGGLDAKGNPICVNGISGRDNDFKAITIEVASDKTKPYAVNEKAYESLIRLCVDIVKRNPGFKGSLRWRGDKNLVGNNDLQNMTVHKWFADTDCPGDFLYNHMVQIAEEVNRRLSQPATVDFVAGDIVYFKGGYDHSNSQDTTTGNKKIASLARVSKVAPNAKYPYHCRRINEKGAYISGGVYGWVSEDTLTT